MPRSDLTTFDAGVQKTVVLHVSQEISQQSAFAATIINTIDYAGMLTHSIQHPSIGWV